MKKFLLTLGLAIAANLTFAQRTVDWSVESIVTPTQLQSTSGGTSFAYDVICKNNGTDSVLIGDTLGFQFSVLQGTNVLLALPNGGVYIRTMNRNVAPNDTIHLTGTFSMTVVAKYSINVTFRVFSLILNGTSKGVFPETSFTNNSSTKNFTWFNQYGWGVSIADINTGIITMYPNPATDEVVINTSLMDASASSEITITDMTGRIVYHETVNMNSGLIVKVSDLNSGLYNVNVKNGKLNTFGKLIVR